MRVTCLLKLITFCILITQHTQAYAATYYIDNLNGDDTNTGITNNAPWKSIAKVNEFNFQPGDFILFKTVQIWEEDLIINSSGTEGSPITFGTYGTGEAILRTLLVYGDYITVENLVIDHNKSDGDAVKIRYNEGCILRNLHIRNGINDGIDIAGTTNVLIEGCYIHHFLAGSYTTQIDAHGLAVVKSQVITIRDTEIHHVSGDSFQADPDRDPSNLTNDIVIENCHFWTGPLTENFNDGWLKTDHLAPDQRQYPGENAIDTKVLTEGWEDIPRMRITLRNITAHGWQKDDYIDNKSVFNLKEKIEATLDGITVYDSEIAFRIRGTRGNANVTIKNAVTYNCEKAIRAEDDVENLKILNSTFGNNIITQIEFAGGDGGIGTWEFKNNAFVDKKPSVANDTTNLAIDTLSLETNFIAPSIHNYHLRTGSQLIGTGVDHSLVSVDREGFTRTSPYDIGAYAYTQSTPSEIKILNILITNDI